MATERLTDGGLELWTSATDLTHWTEFDGGTPTEGVFQESVIVYGGTYSARLLTTIAGDYAGFSQDHTLTPGNNCRISLRYLKAAHASSQLRVYIYDTGSNVSLKSDGTWQAGVLPILMTDSATWKLFELEFTVHVSYANYRIRIYKSHAAGGAISYYVDNISMLDGYEEGEPAPEPGPEVWLGPENEETLLPKLEWLGGSPPSWPVSTKKEMEKTRMSDGSLRVAFHGTKKVFELDYPYLSAEWLEIFKGLNALGQSLRFKNTFEEEIWYHVIISTFSHEPARTDIRQLDRYKVKLILEEIDWRRRTE